MDEFTMCALTCAAAALMLALAGMVQPFFALTLFAISQAGYFSLAQLTKASPDKLSPSAFFVAAAFVCYLLAGFFFGAVNFLSALMYLPLMFCLPAIVVAGREVFLSG